VPDSRPTTAVRPDSRPTTGQVSFPSIFDPKIKLLLIYTRRRLCANTMNQQHAPFLLWPAQAQECNGV
jgi:hypothetical protein